MTDLIRAKPKEIINLQDIIEAEEQHYKSQRRKGFNFREHSLDKSKKSIEKEFF